MIQLHDASKIMNHYVLFGIGYCCYIFVSQGFHVGLTHTVAFRYAVWMRWVQLSHGVWSRVTDKVTWKECHTRIWDWLTGAEYAWCVVQHSHLQTQSHCEYLVCLVFWYTVNFLILLYSTVPFLEICGDPSIYLPVYMYVIVKSWWFYLKDIQGVSRL